MSRNEKRAVQDLPGRARDAARWPADVWLVAAYLRRSLDAQRFELTDTLIIYELLDDLLTRRVSDGTRKDADFRRDVVNCAILMEPPGP
jgi:hypothetical protein